MVSTVYQKTMKGTTVAFYATEVVRTKGGYCY